MPVVKAYVKFDGKNCLDPRALYNECQRKNLSTKMFWGRANAYLLPRGKEPGRGFFLLFKSDYDAIIGDGNTTHTATFYEGADSIAISNLIILGKYSLLGGQAEHDNDVVMIEVADARCVAHLSVMDESFSLRTPDYENYFAESLTGTFAAQVAYLLGELPTVFVSTDATQADFPTGDPEGYCFHGVSPYDALFQLLNDTGHHAYCSRTGSFIIQPDNMADNDNLDLQNLNLKELLHHSHAEAPLPLPETIRVFFPSRDFSFQNSLDGYQVTFNDYWRNHPFDYRDVTTTDVDASAVVIANTTLSLFDSLPAEYTRLGVNTNDGDLDARALARATLYIEAQQLTEQFAHQIYSGLINFTPSPRISAVCWMDIGDGIKTELFLLPRERWTQAGSTLNFDSIFESSDSLVARDYAEFATTEYPTVPDIGRDHIPFERWAVVQLTSDITALGSGSAYVRYANNSLLFANSSKTIVVQDIFGFTHTSGSVVLAMFHGQSRSWVIIGGSENWKLYRFELYDDLALGGSASARIVVWDGAAYTATALAITVTDFTEEPGSWSGKAGYRGWCVYADDSDTFEIIWMELQARHITFELVEPISGGDSAGAEVVTWWDIKEPDDNVDVVDRLGVWEDAPAGATGHAVWDETAQEYVIIWVEHFAEGIAFTTYEDWKAEGWLADVDDYWRGLDPPRDANGRVTLFDPNLLWEDIPAGTKGYASFDKESLQYIPYAIKSGNHVQAIFGTINDPLLTTDATVAGTVTIIASQAPFIGGVAVGDVVTLQNDFDFAGDDNALFYAVWAGGEWIIVQLACPA